MSQHPVSAIVVYLASWQTNLPSENDHNLMIWSTEVVINDLSSTYPIEVIVAEAAFSTRSMSLIDVLSNWETVIALSSPPVIK